VSAGTLTKFNDITGSVIANIYFNA